jgi:integrase
MILTAARIGEAVGARWDEINLETKVWTISPSRMKSGREHQVPLSDGAFKILGEAARLRTNDFVFPGQKTGRSLTAGAIRKFLRLKIVGATNHGFRSSFRDWAGDLGVPREVAEAALAHLVGDETERAYRRGSALEKRREVMESWATYCSGSSAKVIQLRPGAA